MPERSNRKVAAVVAVDVAGYGRLMDRDEAATHTALMAHLGELAEPAIHRRGGRIVKNTGDGLLAEFASILDAMGWSVEVQEAMARRNADVPPARRIEFRMGVNVGDVIVEHDEIFGEGVNAAVRLEGLATPGGICVTSAVYGDVKNKLAIGFRDLGRQKVKNIAEPIHVYAVVVGRNSHWAVMRRRAAPWRAPALAAVGALAFAAVAATAWWQVHLRSPAIHGDWSNPPVLPLPEKPSIAVLPFKNMSGDVRQDYFSDGITEDLITDLSKFSGLFVIAGNSSFIYKRRQASPRRIARELGVRYLLQGSVRRAEDKVRLNVQLVDAATGVQMWAGRYDSDVGDVFDMQDMITRKIVAALAVKLTPTEATARVQPGTVIPAAYEAYLRGRDYSRRRTSDNFSHAANAFKSAVALDPQYSEAHAALAATYFVSRIHLWHRKLGFNSKYAAETSARAALRKAMRRPTSLAHRVAAQQLYMEFRHDEAMGEVERAIALDPNDSRNYAAMSIVLTWSGRARDGVAAIRTAMRLDPHYPPFFQSYFGIAKYALSDFVGAATHLRHASHRNPENGFILIHLLAAYGKLGRRKEAKLALASLNRLRRDVGAQPYSVSVAHERIPYKMDADMNRLLVGLRLAGVPEGGGKR